MSLNSNSLTPEKIEEIVEDLLQKLPERVSISNTRNIVCELLFGLGLHSDDLPLFLLMVVDAYMGERRVDMLNEK